MFEISPPRDTQALRTALITLHGEVRDYLSSFSDDVFFAPQGEAWSPAGHLRHLNKSIKPLVKAMAMPKLMMRVTFGTAKKAPRSFEQIREIYHQALADGADAGPYSPSSKTPDLPPEQWRRKIMGHWSKGNRDLDTAIAGWTEADLDKYRLPHPLLGPLSVREMLYFTLYHNAHHARRIFERSAPEA